MTRSIIFDFDGTLAVGHGPVMAYARAVAPYANQAFAERVEAELRAFDGGASRYRDGYHVVAELASQDGVSAGTMNQAYLASRAVLGTPEAPVDAPAGLGALLDDLHRHAEIHLATNAPATGVEQVLETWGVRKYFDHVHVGVGKPDGLYPIVERALASGPVLAIGDIVAFDLQPALDLGAETALVGPAATSSDADVTMRGTDLAALRDELLAWAAQPTDTINSSQKGSSNA